MDQHISSPENLAQLQRMAQSPAGQQLIRLLQQNGGADFQNAMRQASLGNLDQAKSVLSSLLSAPEAQSLLRQLGGEP